MEGYNEKQGFFWTQHSVMITGSGSDFKKKIAQIISQKSSFSFMLLFMIGLKTVKRNIKSFTIVIRILFLPNTLVYTVCTE